MSDPGTTTTTTTTMTATTSGTCARCRHPIKAGARFCPTCGATADAAAAPGSAASDGAAAPASPAAPRDALARRLALRETILGWLFLLVGLGLVLAALFVRGWGWRAVVAGILGGSFLLLGFGTLMGESKPRGG